MLSCNETTLKLYSFPGNLKNIYLINNLIENTLLKKVKCPKKILKSSIVDCYGEIYKEKFIN